MNQGKEIAAKETGEAFSHMLKTDRLIRTKHHYQNKAYIPPASIANLESCIEARIIRSHCLSKYVMQGHYILTFQNLCLQKQKQRWAIRKTELREAKTRAIMSCMDAILRVISINFKVQLAPGVIQDIKGHMYTSLLDKV